MYFTEIISLGFATLSMNRKIPFTPDVYAGSSERQILKATTEVFDLLGLYTPVTLQAKPLLLEL